MYVYICIDIFMHVMDSMTVQFFYVHSNKIWFLCVLILKHLDNDN